MDLYIIHTEEICYMSGRVDQAEVVVRGEDLNDFIFCFDPKEVKSIHKVTSLKKLNKTQVIKKAQKRVKE